MTKLDLAALLIEHGHTLVQRRAEDGPAGMEVYVCVHRHRGCVARAHVRRGTDTVTWTHSVGRDCASKQQPRQQQQEQREERVG